MIENLEKLPRTISSQVKFQLTIRAFEREWVIAYEYAGLIFGEVISHGETLEKAIDQMCYNFENHEAFKFLQHLYNQPAKSDSK